MIITRNNRFIVRKKTFPSYDVNAYIIECRGSGESTLIDAPERSDLLAAALERTSPRVLLLTHGHPDHTGALRALRIKLGVPLAAHAGDADILPAPIDIRLEDGDEIRVGGVTMSVIHTPGHTPGGLCFRLENILFSGDTLFPGGPGRTATPEDFRVIFKSIRDKLMPLPDSTQVHPGHGPPTTIGKVRREIAVFTGRPHPPGLCGNILWERS